MAVKEGEFLEPTRVKPITGKGFKVQSEQYVTVVGGVNIDIIGFPADNLVPRDSSPGIVKVSLGGVGRNIAENLVRLGVPTKLVSAVGDDMYGQKVLAEAKLVGLDMQDSLILTEQPTSTYMAVLDEKGNMSVAIAHMSIFDEISIEFIKQKEHLIENSKACVIDTNIPREVIEYMLAINKRTDFILDPVSTVKAMKVKELIGEFHTIKPNKIEAEVLSGIEINSKKDLETCAEYFLNKGVKRVFVSLGEEGLYYNDGTNKGHVPAHKISIANATGAGDACTAALVYCYHKDFDIDYSTRFAMSASALALAHEDTINPNMSVENVRSLIS